MRKEELEKLKFEGPLNFEFLVFNKKSKNQDNVDSGLVYKEALEGNVRIKNFYKKPLRFADE